MKQTLRAIFWFCLGGTVMTLLNSAITLKHINNNSKNRRNSENETNWEETEEWYY